MEKIILDNPWIVFLILLWTLPWKGVALWIAARRGHIGWFLTLLVINSLAILDILYIFIFSKWGMEKKPKHKKQTKQEPEPEPEEAPIVRQPRFSSSINSRSTIV